MGRMLEIDLGKRKIAERDLPLEFLGQWLGGSWPGVKMSVVSLTPASWRNWDFKPADASPRCRVKDKHGGAPR